MKSQIRSVMPPNRYQLETLGHTVGGNQVSTLDTRCQGCGVRTGLMPFFKKRV